jgi:thiazole synthase
MIGESLKIDNLTLQSRLFLGTAGYPSPDILRQCIEAANPGLITVSLRRENAAGKGQKFWEIIKGFNIPVLPNTAGCHTVREAVTTAEMAREVFQTNWIKLEIIADDYTLAPDPVGLVEATEQLIHKGFKVFPYMTEDENLAQKLVDLGCDILMPWGAPIGSGRGLCNIPALKILRTKFPGKMLVVDAGIGAPSHAAAAMELGYDAVLLNTAVAKATDPVAMARAFAGAIEAGRAAFMAGIIAPQENAEPSTPMIDRPFWHQGAA